MGFELHNRDKGKSTFLVDKTQSKQKIERLLPPNIERFEKSAESRYRDFRAKSEFAFRKEILAYIRRHKKVSDFFRKQILDVLKRMREFWAFKAVGFLCYSAQTRDLCIIGYGYENEEGIKEKGIGFPGEKVGSISFVPKQEYPLGWFYDPKAPETPQNPWIKQFLPLFEDARNDPSISLPEEGCYFLVVVPFGDEIYVFVLIARDIEKVSLLQGRRPVRVSELCQEFMLRTCTEIIHEFAYVRVFAERRDQLQKKHFQELKSKINEDITKLSVSCDLSIDELLKDDELSKESRKNVLQIKEIDSKIVPIIEKRFEEELEKLKSNT